MEREGDERAEETGDKTMKSRGVKVRVTAFAPQKRRKQVPQIFPEATQHKWTRRRQWENKAKWRYIAGTCSNASSTG